MQVFGRIGSVYRKKSYSVWTLNTANGAGTLLRMKPALLPSSGAVGIDIDLCGGAILDSPIRHGFGGCLGVVGAVLSIADADFHRRREVIRTLVQRVEAGHENVKIVFCVF